MAITLYRNDKDSNVAMSPASASSFRPTISAIAILFLVTFGTTALAAPATESSTQVVRVSAPNSDDWFVEISMSSWGDLKSTVENATDMAATANNITDVFADQPDIESLGYKWRPGLAVCSLCAVENIATDPENCHRVIESPCDEKAQTLKTMVVGHLTNSVAIWRYRPLVELGGLSYERYWELTGLSQAYDTTDIDILREEYEWYSREQLFSLGVGEIDVAKYRDFAKFSDDYDFETRIDDKTIAPGFWVIRVPASCAAFPAQRSAGRLAQTDSTVALAGALVAPAIQGIGEYSFDVEYIGGLDDDAIGFAAIVPGFMIGLEWDPQNLGGSGLHARMYILAKGCQIHQRTVVGTYDIDSDPRQLVTIDRRRRPSP